MAQPQPYSPSHDFIPDTNIGHVPGQQLNVEFDHIQTTTDQIRANLAIIQRDDGEIANESIDTPQLTPRLQTLMGSLQTAIDAATGPQGPVGPPGPLAQAGLPSYYYAKSFGLACDGVTDDTAAFNTLLATVNTAGGGTIVFNGMARINGQITLPNDGLPAPKQNYIRLTGFGGNSYGQFITAPAGGISGLDLRYNAPIAKIITLGTGLLEIDHITIRDAGNDSATFFKTTHTTLHVHDCAIIGTAAAPSAVNDCFIFGGSSIIDNTTDSAFQGYGTIIRHNQFDNIRKAAIFNGAANGIAFVENTVSLTCGDSTTKAITAATNANPTVLTAASHGFSTNDKIRLNISGATGNWTPINGATVTITVIDANRFSVPVDATSFGALTGSPVFPDGTFLDFVGSAVYSTAGNYIAGNLVEMVYYGYFARLANNLENQFVVNNLFDAPAGSTVAFYKAVSNAAAGGMIINGYVDGGTPILVGAARSGINVLNGSASASALDIQTTWLTDAVYSGLNTYTGGVNTGIRSDSTTKLQWTGPAKFDGGVQSTSSVSGDIVVTGGVGIGKQLNVVGTTTLSSATNFVGTAGSSNQLIMPQSSGNAIMNADGSALVFRNGGSGALYFDSFGTGVTNFRSNGGSTTQMTITQAGQANVLLSVAAHTGTAIPAGGTAGAGIMVSSATNFGVFFGSGAPTLSAAKGSLYLRSDGTTTNDRMYVNTNGSTTWTAVTTAA